MTTPNNAAALECVLDEMGAFIEQEESPNLDTLENWHQRLRATLAQPDTLTSQPSGEAPEWVELKRNEFGYFYQTSAPAVRMPTGRYFFHPTHPSADAPGVAVDEAEVTRAARALVAKLEAIHVDPKFMAVWHCAHNHMGPYTGPQYVGELSALTAALAPKPEGGHG